MGPSKRPLGKTAAVRAAARDTLSEARSALQSLGQAVKLRALYSPGHPIPSVALQDCRKCLAELFARTQWRQASFALVEGRWLVNGMPLGDAQICETLAAAFQGRLFDSLEIMAGVQSYELEAFCEIAATPMSKREELDPAETLAQKGVVRIRIESVRYSRTKEMEPSAPAPAPIESPIPRRAQPRAPAAGQTFSGMLKGLVEGAVEDPEEQARIYAQAVKTVKEALEKRVSEQTRKLREEAQRVLDERIRTEHVLAAMAEGKVIVDAEGRVLMMDPAAEKIVGKRLVDLAGKSILEGVNSDEQIVSMVNEDGSPEGGGGEAAEAFRGSMALVHNEEGRIVGTYGVLPAAAKFRETAKMQEDFLSQVTHELKAPLTSIRSALELVEKLTASKLGPDEKRFLEISKRNSLVLGGMIDQILDFSKLQSGRMSVKTEPTRVSEILREGVDGLRPWASSKGISLEASANGLPEAFGTVMADRGRAAQILTNIVSNAIKSTPKGGSIVVSAEPGTGKNSGWTVFSVKDTGCGIALEDQERIFQKFIQVAPKGAVREGVGLGLAIVKELVDLHKGKLWLESAPGRGTTFHFTLPVPS